MLLQKAFHDLGDDVAIDARPAAPSRRWNISRNASTVRAVGFDPDRLEHASAAANRSGAALAGDRRCTARRCTSRPHGTARCTEVVEQSELIGGVGRPAAVGGRHRSDRSTGVALVHPDHPVLVGEGPCAGSRACRATARSPTASRPARSAGRGTRRPRRRSGWSRRHVLVGSHARVSSPPARSAPESTWATCG